MKSNQVISIGLFILSGTLILKEVINMPHIIYLTLLIISIIVEIIGMLIANKEKKDRM